MARGAHIRQGWTKWRRARGCVFALLVLSNAIPNPACAQDAKAFTDLHNRILQLKDAGRYDEGVDLARGMPAQAERLYGPEHPNVGVSLNNLAELYRAAGRYSEAEPVYRRGLANLEKGLGPGHPAVGNTLDNLASLYQQQGRLNEAEPLFKRGLAVRESALGPDDVAVGTSLNNLAGLYRELDRLTEAEPLLKRGLAIYEKSLKPDHPWVGIAINNLGNLYRNQRRYAEAEQLYERARAVYEKALGPSHPSNSTVLSNLAELYSSQGRTVDAERMYKQSLDLFEKALGPDHPGVAILLNNLAPSYERRGRYSEAEAMYQRSLAIREKALGPDHPDVAQSLRNLAGLIGRQGRNAEADEMLQRSLKIYSSALGADHARIGEILNNLAGINLRQGKWPEAANYWRRSAALHVRRLQRGVAVAVSAKEKTGTDDRFLGLIKVLHRVAAKQQDSQATLTRETFEMAQWDHSSEAAASLAQMAARSAKGNAGLATIVRERQDLVAAWQKQDDLRTAAVSQQPDKRDHANEAANTARLNATDARIADIDKRLAVEFPDYAAFSRPAPLTVQQVQVDLRPDEALVLFLDTPEWNPTPEETFMWVVTKSDSRWVRFELGTPSLQREVAALRCGLDSSAWNGNGVLKCADLLKLTLDKAPKENEPLPFDLGRSHNLYQALFGQVGDLIKGKHLLIVPSGPLTQLPFQVLVTQKHDTELLAAEGFRRAPWLSRNNAITVLPAVSSLKALRQLAKASHATKPFVGFGNPLLSGPDERYAELAKAALNRQECPKTTWQRVAGLFGKRDGIAPRKQRGGSVDVEDVRIQLPLPETADELCAVARSLGVTEGHIQLGSHATETVVKSLSDTGRLANYRIVHFATHGLLSGQLADDAEPGLIMTPPAKATNEDDGYLSASEIASLKFDADWVILSACNTAAGGAEGAEALSGLARAFFYAGARALLVSHWAVYSESTVKLITKALSIMAADKKVGRSEALRRAMLALIEKGEPHEAHPSYWAPFVVVGEGAR
jgi:CHAT domain-containing protein/tetratricopeptide (TPR) repeat protein